MRFWGKNDHLEAVSDRRYQLWPGHTVFIMMTLLAAMLPNSKPPAWVKGFFQLTVVLGFVGTLTGIGFFLLALMRWATGVFR